MEHLSVRDAVIAFDQSGKGDTDLVLVHGFQNDRSAWDLFVARLDGERFRVTRFDLVGCGVSAAAKSWSRCTIDEYAQDLAAVCEALRLAAPIVVGHSLGGGTALRAALREPDRFAGLVLVAPVSTTGLDFLSDGAFEGLVRPSVEQQRELARAAFRRPPSPGDFAALMAVIARATPEHIEGAARSMRDFRCQGELARLAPPALLVCGDRDRHVPLRNRLATAQAIPRCGLQVYYDVGHVPFAETPDAFAADVLRFVGTIRTPRSHRLRVSGPSRPCCVGPRGRNAPAAGAGAARNAARRRRGWAPGLHMRLPARVHSRRTEGIMQVRLLPVLLVVAFVAIACDRGSPAPPEGKQAPAGYAPVSNRPPLDPDNIVSIAVRSPDHTTLVAAIEAADYVTSVAASGPLTVFAPTNEAFGKLPPGTVDSLLEPANADALRKVLQYHVTTSALATSSLRDGQTLGMANGAKTTIRRDGETVTINDARVLASIPASNGIVHVIDRVLLPPEP